MERESYVLVIVLSVKMEEVGHAGGGTDKLYGGGCFGFNLGYSASVSLLVLGFHLVIYLLYKTFIIDALQVNQDMKV